MTRVFRKAGEVDAKEAQCCRQALVGRGIEEDLVAPGFYREPRVLPEFVLQLTGRPARVAQCHEQALGTFAATDRLENVL